MLTAMDDKLKELKSEGIEVVGAVPRGFEEILTPEALRFAASLVRKHGARREELLQRRADRQRRFDAGETPHFLEEGKAVREDDSWRTAPVPEDLKYRWVEITGPASVRSMVINALNSGAKAYMADFEDSDSPTWENMLNGQQNMYDAIRRKIDFTDEKKGKQYRLNEETATLIVRPRGWHLLEKHVLIDGKPVSASLFDFALYFFLNAKRLTENGSGPYYYLPKMESHLEARLWNDVFNSAQQELNIPKGTIRVTALIETLPAAFEIEEILYELRDHIVGLNCGRWDYIFSYIKTLARHADKVMPDRDSVTMQVPFMMAYQKEVLRACNKRGAYPIGGMAAQIPIKDDPAANEASIGKVRADKEREVGLGFYGTWAAHPALVKTIYDVFEKGIGGKPTNKCTLEDGWRPDAASFLETPRGARTYGALYSNIKIGIEYLASWLSGSGCVPLYHKMEDAATSEISRAQVWQWLTHGIELSDGRKVDRKLFYETFEKAMADIREELGEGSWSEGELESAGELFSAMSTSESFEPFLTISAYEKIVKTS